MEEIAIASVSVQFICWSREIQPESYTTSADGRGGRFMRFVCVVYEGRLTWNTFKQKISWPQGKGTHNNHYIYWKIPAS